MKRIESKKNPQVKQWKKLQTKKERDKTGLFLIEGVHLVEEALKYKGNISEVLFTESFQMPHHWNLDEVEVYIVAEEVLNEIGDTETPQGVAAICRKPSIDLERTTNSVLLIDAVQDPGNLGTLIRTADAAGVDQIVIGEGTVDIYNSKVLRASQGSIFHIPISKGNLYERILQLRDSGHTIFGTSLDQAEPFQNIKHTGPFSLIVGNEGRGVQQELLSLTHQNLYIPIHGKAESLNVTVAAGILLYYLRG
ncbi:TrmH family RNA methyltransferase [Bacillus mesophilus]|uniref:RNA methyltransferase n=1 Tax=Bacillus mesophilus TaxID=1808955 RepID=A0A6M0Q6D0_9BACI|nr:RNA methyltransferase [Bacillus mesophilus]MBM7660598.1 TrmH family RNA methyltransferase [Bacillus mesophilus]NEY71854.1 RNA methyltransferase [Bacillus mesophilus]